MGLLPKAIKSFKKNSMFFKLLSFFMVLLVISIAAVGSFSYFNSSRLLVEEVKDYNMSVLEKARDDIDRMIEILDRTTLQIAVDNRVKKALYIDSAIKPEIIELSLQIIPYLTSIKSSTSFIDSIILYFNRSKMIITDDGKYDFGTYMKNIYDDTILPEEWWMEIFNHYTMFKHINAYDDKGNFIQNRKITFAKSLPLGSRSPYCTVFIRIDRNVLNNIFMDISDRNRVSLYIMNSNGDIIAGNDINNLDDELKVQVIDKVLKSSSENSSERVFMDMVLEGNKYTIAYLESSVNDWKYASVIPMDYIMEKSNNIKNVTIATVIASLILGLFISYALTRNIYSPINGIINYLKMIKGLETKGGNDKGENEISFINRLFDFVYSENKYLRDAVSKSTPILREKLLGDLLEGRVKPGDLHNMIGDINMELPFNAHQVITYEADDYSGIPQRISDSLTENIKKRIDNISGKKPFYPDIRVYSITKTACRVVSLVNLDSNYEKPDIIYDLVNEVTGHFRKEYGITFTVGIGNIYYNSCEIASSYIESLYALKYKIIEGQDRIIHIDEVSGATEHIYNYSMESERMIMNFVKSGDFESAEKYIREILKEHILNKPATPEMIDFLFISLAGTAIRVIYDIQCSVEIIFGEGFNIFGTLNETDTIEQKEKYILDIFRKVSSYTNQRRKCRKDKLFDRINDYITRNYQKELSLDIIGDEIGLSPSYLSWLFKEISGMNFVDYLNSYRVKKSKELLEKSDLSIFRIGENVGFTNTNTFIRVFKKYEGITPGKYRSICTQV
jgi:two-component system response regulator YesN